MCLLIIGLLYTSVLSEWASVFLLGVLVGWLGPGLVGTARFLVNLFIFPMDNYDLCVFQPFIVLILLQATHSLEL